MSIDRKKIASTQRTFEGGWAETTAKPFGTEERSRFGRDCNYISSEDVEHMLGPN